MRFVGVCIVSRDIQRTRDFYVDVLRAPGDGDSIFSTVATEGAALSIYAEEGMEQLAPHVMEGAGSGSCTLEFEVDDVDREFERLKALQVPIVKPPTTQSWGRRSVWFRDPDGNIVNFFANTLMTESSHGS